MSDPLRPLSYQELTSLLPRLQGYQAQILQLMRSIDLHNDLGNRDHLTGLYNRNYAREHFDGLQNILCRTRPDSKIGLLYLDIDHFKKVNDTHGHDVGDEVIKKLAQTLQGASREGDIVFRCGKGEEIGLMFEANSAEDVLKVGKRIREIVNANPYVSEKHNICVTSSFAGLALSPQQCATLDDALALADPLLYNAKERGRDCIVVAPDDKNGKALVFPDRTQQSTALSLPEKQSDDALSPMKKEEKKYDLPGHIQRGSIFQQLDACEKEIALLVGKLNHAQERAHTDGMTGVLNRRGGESEYKKMIAHMMRHDPNGKLGVLFLDIDHFKNINDVHGHKTGDAGLEHVSKILKEYTRSGDKILRYGGEEFAVVFRAKSIRHVLSVGRRLRRLLEQSPLKAYSKSIHMTMSAGAEIFTLDELKDKNLNDILKKADEAMYLAKHKGGRNCLAVIGKNGNPRFLGEAGHKSAALRPRRNPRSASLEHYRRNENKYP